MTDLTTAARVKEQFFPGVASPPTTHDTLFADLIAEVTDRIRVALDYRDLDANDYTEYVDGEGACLLRLAQGPLNTVTSVEEVTYSKDGDGDSVETLTTIDKGDYVLRGLTADGHLGKATIERLGAVWTLGQRNYKVVYNAGFSSVPTALRRIATNEVLLDARAHPGLRSLRLGDYQVAFAEDKNRETALMRALSPFLSWAA